MKHRIFSFAFIFLLLVTFAFPQNEDLQGEPVTIESMLAAYISNDRQTQILAAQYQQAVLSHESVQNSTGLDVELSTGTVSIRAGQFRAEPAVTLSMPTLNGTVVAASVPVSVYGTDGKASVGGSSVSIETEILGGGAMQQRLSLVKSQRNVLEFRRSLEEHLLSTEYDFYSNLKSIYTEYASVLSAQNTLYEEKIDLDAIVVQGYGPKSSRYRTAQLEMLNAQHIADERQRRLERSVEKFAQKCNLDPKKLTANEIPDVSLQLESSGILEEPVTDSVHNYKAMEKAEWNMEITKLEQKADSQVSLYAGAGYTHKNTTFADNDTVNASLSLGLFGARLSAGVAVPVTGESRTPAAQFSLSWSPSDLKSDRIKKQQNALDVHLALLQIQEAQESYETDMEDSLTDRTDLLWTRQLNLEQAELYRELVDDMASWFAAGYVTDSENRQAQVNLQNALIQCRITDIELLLNSIKTKMLFVVEED